MDAIVDALVRSDEPSVRWKVRTRVLDEDPESRAIVRLREEIRRSPRVRALVEGAAGASYRKWSGGHWVLITLADIGYPAGDPELEPLAEQVMQTWLAPRYYAEFETATSPYKHPAVPLMAGRYRRPIGSSNACCTGSGRMAAGTAAGSSPPYRRPCTRRCYRCVVWPRTQPLIATRPRARLAPKPRRCCSPGECGTSSCTRGRRSSVTVSTCATLDPIERSSVPMWSFVRDLRRGVGLLDTAGAASRPAR